MITVNNFEWNIECIMGVKLKISDCGSIQGYPYDTSFPIIPVIQIYFREFQKCLGQYSTIHYSV